MMRFFVGPLGIEPSLHAPEACVLPVYYGPAKNLIVYILLQVVTNISSPPLGNFATPARGPTSLRDNAAPCTARSNVPKGTFFRRGAPFRIRT